MFRRVATVTLLFFCLPIAAQDRSDLDQTLSGKIESALKESGAPSISVAVVEHGATVLARGFGQADIAAGRAADAGTRYAVGSISKQFTTVALLLLEEQGK